MDNTLFEHRNKINIHVLLIELICTAVILIQYNLIRTDLNVPGNWHIQFYALLTVNMLFTLILFIPGLLLRASVLGLKLAILLLLSYPLNDNLGVLSVLLTSFILNTIIFLPLTAGLTGAAASILITVFSHNEVQLWEGTIQRMTTQNRIFLAFYGLIIIMLAGGLKKLLMEYWTKISDYNQLDRALNQLNRVNLDFQSYAVTVERESVERERKRVSRELHDIIGYTMTSQLMIIQAVLSLKDRHSPQLDELLQKAQKQLNEGMSDARSALRQLHRSSEHRERGWNLMVKLVKTFENITGVSVALELSNAPNLLDEKLEKAFYRFIQEGMTNSFRHGHASEIKIIFWREPEKIKVSLWDNGSGGVINKEGIGLQGMRERFNSLGGDLEADGSEGGFTLKGWLPLETG